MAWPSGHPGEGGFFIYSLLVKMDTGCFGLKIENLKPFSGIHFRILFMLSCIVRSKFLRCVPSM